MTEEAMQATAGEPGGGKGIEKENTPADGQVNREGQQTYTQDDFDKALQAQADKRVTEALKTAQAKWQDDFEKKVEAAVSEAQRLAGLSAEEQKEEIKKKEQEKYKAERAQFEREKSVFEATQLLAAHKLPVAFSKMLAGKDAEETGCNIAQFKSAWNSAIEEAVNERLKGRTPPAASGGNGPADPFLKGFGL